MKTRPRCYYPFFIVFFNKLDLFGILIYILPNALQLSFSLRTDLHHCLGLNICGARDLFVHALFSSLGSDFGIHAESHGAHAGNELHLLQVVLRRCWHVLELAERVLGVEVILSHGLVLRCR